MKVRFSNTTECWHGGDNEADYHQRAGKQVASESVGGKEMRRRERGAEPES
jgi:hypothetical protein